MSSEVMTNIGDNHIYFVGAVALDIILHLHKYPGEDEKISASGIERRRGGNSGNSLEIISQLIKNQKIYFLGAFGETVSNCLAQDLITRGVSLEFSVFRPQVENSTSYILSTSTTRAIINYNPVQDMSWQEFSKCLSSLHPEQNWFHFEGRNIAETRCMMAYLKENASSSIRVSVELEKGDRENIESLIPLADVLFFSSSFAKNRGYECGSKFLQDYSVLKNVKNGYLFFYLC
jgi:ketohexokinase